MGAAEQYQSVRDELDAICTSCGRKPDEVTLLAVSKTTDVTRVQDAMSAGAINFGENRPDELMLKATALPHAHWHFIGNVQSRRISDIVAYAQLIHSVYKADHFPKIERAAAALGKVQDVLIEVNVSGEQAKGGVVPEDLAGLIARAHGLGHVRVCGLMTMAPQGDIAVAQECFARLRQLRDQTNTVLPAGMPALTELSMGMSEDWKVAVAEGATIVRVGRAIFQESFG